MGTGGSGSHSSRSSFFRTHDAEPTLWPPPRPTGRYRPEQNSVEGVNSVRSASGTSERGGRGGGKFASSSQSGIQQGAVGTSSAHTATAGSDVTDQRSSEVVFGTLMDYRWWAFVNGVTSPPGGQSVH